MADKNEARFTPRIVDGARLHRHCAESWIRFRPKFLDFIAGVNCFIPLRRAINRQTTGLMVAALMWAGLMMLTTASAEEMDAFQFNHLLGRGINLGNALDAPSEGAWGVTLEAGYFATIKDAGFTSVRIPIRWSAHAGTEPPYQIDPAFFQRVDWAIDQALSHNLIAVINVHHYLEMSTEPLENKPRFVSLWKQIALHYSKRPDELIFELMNEPSGQLTDELWQEVFPDLLRTIRESNPRRIVIIGPAHSNGLNHLENMRLPADDRRLIATFHYYSPLQFTHQGASWVNGADAWKGTKWLGTAEERQSLEMEFDLAAKWAELNQRPIYLGEFGAFQEADMDSRVRWTSAAAGEAERRGFSWAYWEFCSGFGAYDPSTRTWRQPLLRALIGNK